MENILIGIFFYYEFAWSKQAIWSQLDSLWYWLETAQDFFLKIKLYIFSFIIPFF